jgi:hypothetical protein
MKLQTLRAYNPVNESTAEQQIDAGPPIDPKQQPSFPELNGQAVDSSTVENQPAIVDPNTPIADMSEELYWAEVRLAGSMAEVERSRIELETRIQEYQADVTRAEAQANTERAKLEACKDELKAATDRLLGLARKLVELTQDKKLPTEEELTKLESEDTDGWRLASTVELLTKAKIKGLSQKKIDLLAEHAPTLGHLEDLRGLASKEFVPYQDKLPKGIGASVASAIEDVQEQYLREWTAKRNDPARIKLGDDLLAECRELVSEWNASDCVPKVADSEHLHAGHTAFGQKCKHTEYLSDDRELAKQWITGWVMAERASKLKGE